MSCGSSFLVELDFWGLVFEDEGKPEHLEKNPWSKTKPTTISTCIIYGTEAESNPSHIGWRRGLSPLHHPCSLEFQANLHQDAPKKRHKKLSFALHLHNTVLLLKLTWFSSGVAWPWTTCFSSNRMTAVWRNWVEPTVQMRCVNSGSWRCSGIWGDASTNTLINMATMSLSEIESFLVSCGNCCLSPA